MSILSLKPFEKNSWSDSLKLNCELSLQKSDRLSFAFTVQGALDSIEWGKNFQGVAMGPTDGLYEKTCFELFLKDASSAKYYEFNFSNSGDWCVFAFDDYRKPAAERMVFKSFPGQFSSSGAGDDVKVTGEISLDALTKIRLPFQVGISAVLCKLDKSKSYWALAHSKSKPDFHDVSGFRELHR